MKKAALVLLVFMSYLAILLLIDDYEYIESINSYISEYKFNKITNLYEYHIIYNNKEYIVRTNRYYENDIDLDIYRLHLFRSTKIKTRGDRI